ncbi:MAG: hypothetical protein WAV46_02080 [Candidatus Moraniibacteriota bacterium]
MKIKTLLGVSAVYMGLLGLGFLLVPGMMSLGAVPAGASAAMIAYLRIPASLFIGIAVVNWMVRKAEPDAALRVIVFGNMVGFGLTALLEVLSAFSDNRISTFVFAAINMFFAVAFLLARGQAQQANPQDPGHFE